jgi:uncharacterized protein (TIGR00297 family)
MFELVQDLNPWLMALGLNGFLLALAFSLPKKLLTPAGYLHAWCLGVIIWGGLGWRGYTLVLVYFFVGSAVTKIGLAQKMALGIAEKRSGQRGPENVWGSASTAALCALLTLVLAPTWHSWLWLAYVASFSTKLADTCASEVGKAYGQRTFLITTLKPVPRGTEGAISLEGTLAGIVGSVIIASLAWGLGVVTAWGLLWTIIAAFIATNLESLLGATLQSRWPWLTNEVVNGINTLLGALIVVALAGYGPH